MSAKNNTEKTASISEEAVRFQPSADTGLSAEQAMQRKKEGLYNRNTQPKGKSVKRILYDNIVTLFNMINVI